jgi:hypothetical protein
MLLEVYNASILLDKCPAILEGLSNYKARRLTRPTCTIIYIVWDVLGIYISAAFLQSPEIIPNIDQERGFVSVMRTWLKFSIAL